MPAPERTPSPWSQRVRAGWQRFLDAVAVQVAGGADAPALDADREPDPAQAATPARPPSSTLRTRRISDAELDAVIGDCGLYEAGERRTGRIPLSRAVRELHRTDGFVWIGLQQPSAAEVGTVADAFGLPALAVEDAIRAHQRPKVEQYGDVLFVILKPVRYVDHDEVVDVAEVALFVGPRFVVTVRHGESDVLRRVRRELDDGGADLAARGPAGLLHRIMDVAVDGYEDAVRGIDEDVDEIESQVFATDDGDVGEGHSVRIYKLKREVAEFRRAVLPLAAALEPMVAGRVPQVPVDLGPHYRDVLDHVLRTADAIEGHDRLLSDVLQADLARVAAEQSRIAVLQNEIAGRQNEDMRKISAWAAIGLVPTAIAGIYGMNFDNIPELHWHYGYFAALGVIAVVCTGLYRSFRRNGWL